MTPVTFFVDIDEDEKQIGFGCLACGVIFECESGPRFFPPENLSGNVFLVCPECWAWYKVFIDLQNQLPEPLLVAAGTGKDQVKVTFPEDYEKFLSLETSMRLKSHGVG